MIGEVRLPSVVTISSGASIRAAARLMRDRNVRTLVISDMPNGILTDRDIAIAVVAEGLDPRDVFVADVMHDRP